MPHSFTFHKFSELKPDHDEDVFFVKTDDFYGSYEFAFARTEYQWQEVCPDGGAPTGTSIVYDPSDPVPPEGCVLVVLAGDSLFQPETLWASCKHIEDVLEAAGT